MLISGFENDTFNQAKLDEILIDIRRTSANQGTPQHERKVNPPP
jgi:hypothetical protein